MIEVNALAETLRVQRLGAQEAAALLPRGHGGNRCGDLRLRCAQRRLVLVNRFGENATAQSAAHLLNRLR
jgi:hypothetical protein